MIRTGEVLYINTVEVLTPRTVNFNLIEIYVAEEEV